MSRWSLLIFRSHVQGSRSSHSFDPSVLSAQYLVTPSLDQYQTWCRGCPQWVNDPYWFSGHMFKGQGQTTLLSPVCWRGHLSNAARGHSISLTSHLFSVAIFLFVHVTGLAWVRLGLIWHEDEELINWTAGNDLMTSWMFSLTWLGLNNWYLTTVFILFFMLKYVCNIKVFNYICTGICSRL